MVTMNPHEDIPQVSNHVHRHAFVLVGQEQLFGVHMTQYHCELHKYQVILKLTLPPEVHEEFRRLRINSPNETFVLCNAKNRNPGEEQDDVREFCIPDIGSGLVKKFSANLFQGFRPLPPEIEKADKHYFPWDANYCRPVIGEFEAIVERVVLFRPFDHLDRLPSFARYYLFGDGKSGESHMTNLQTAQLVTDSYEPQVFGPDYDHVMSLAARPDWLEQDAMLEAGIVVTTPGVRLLDPDTGQASLPASQPFPEGSEIEVLYRGLTPARSVIAGPCFSYVTMVCNSPRFFAERPTHDSYLDSLPPVPQAFEFTTMPRHYWVIPPKRKSDTEEQPGG